MQRDIKEELSDLQDEERVWNLENCQRLQWVAREVRSGNTVTVNQYVSRLQSELVEMRITNQKLMLALRLRAQTIDSLQTERMSGGSSVEIQTDQIKTVHSASGMSEDTPVCKDSQVEKLAIRDPNRCRAEIMVPLASPSKDGTPKDQARTPAPKEREKIIAVALHPQPWRPDFEVISPLRLE